MRQLDIIRAGELRTPVVFKKQPQIGDSTGNIEDITSSTNFDNWETRCETRGKLELERGNELREDHQDVALQYMILFIRYNAANLPSTSDVAVCDGTPYQIRYVSDVNGRKRLVQIGLLQVK